MAISDHPLVSQKAVEISAGPLNLKGDLSLPEAAIGMVVFAHGSGSGRFSPRNQFVAGELQKAGLGTLLLDLLSEDEADDRSKVFDIGLLAERVLIAMDWLAETENIATLPVGLFGASTGAAAALMAAARKPQAVRAVVSRGGRPDMALEHLPRVTAPTLLIVGGYDYACIPLNEDAHSRLKCEKRLVIVPCATHLFPEPGTLEEVGRLASEWFTCHLSPWRSR